MPDGLSFSEGILQGPGAEEARGGQGPWGGLGLRTQLAGIAPFEDVNLLEALEDRKDRRQEDRSRGAVLTDGLLCRAQPVVRRLRHRDRARAGARSGLVAGADRLGGGVRAVPSPGAGRGPLAEGKVRRAVQGVPTARAGRRSPLLLASAVSLSSAHEDEVDENPEDGNQDRDRDGFEKGKSVDDAEGDGRQDRPPRDQDDSRDRVEDDGPVTPVQDDEQGVDRVDGHEGCKDHDADDVQRGGERSPAAKRQRKGLHHSRHEDPVDDAVRNVVEEQPVPERVGRDGQPGRDEIDLVRPVKIIHVEICEDPLQRIRKESRGETCLRRCPLIVLKRSSRTLIARYSPGDGAVKTMNP